MTEEMVEAPRPRVNGGRKFYMLSALAVFTGYAAIVIVWIGVVIIGRSPVITIVEKPRILAGAQRPGDPLRYQFGYCRDHQGPLQVAREIIEIQRDGVQELTPLADAMVTIEPGCGTVRMTLPTSPTMVPGTYAVRLTFLELSALGRRSVVTETNHFEVASVR